MPESGPARGAERHALEALLVAPPEQAARMLLGQRLVRAARPGQPSPLVLRIVETEAYLGCDDPAAHAFHGRTARTEPLWGPPGTVYIYLVYGLHHCLNLAVQPEGTPGCVLIRAAEPLAPAGLPASACRGPGRLCRTLSLDRRASGSSVFGSGPLWLRAGPAPERVSVSPRVGIRHATDWPLRFCDVSSPAVSRPGARRSGR